MQETGSSALELEEATNSLKVIRNSRATREAIATYFGLTVEVIVWLENCGLIRYRGREFVVSTDDLLEFENREPAALSAA